MAADGSHGGDLLLLAKPFLDLQGQNEEESLTIKDLTNTHLNGLGISHIDVDCKMLELLTMEIVRALQLLHVINVWADYKQEATLTLVRVPLLPFTVTALALTEASMPSGTSISSKELISFMTSATGDYRL